MKKNEYKKQKQTHTYSEEASRYQREEDNGEGRYRGRELKGTNYCV